MKSPFTYWIAFLCATTSIIPIARSAEKDKPGERLAWVLMASASNELSKTSRVFSGGESVEIINSKRNTSPALKIAEDGLISVAKFNEDLQPGKPWLKISVPEKMQQVLIILIPEVGADGGMKLKSKIWSLSSFEPGDWLFLNLTTSTIRVTEDGNTLEIPSNSESLSKAPTTKEYKSVALSYDYKKKVGDNWSSISASAAVRQTGRREICIFTEDLELGTIDYHGLSFVAK